jgi:hypothetical protein
MPDLVLHNDPKVPAGFTGTLGRFLVATRLEVENGVIKTVHLFEGERCRFEVNEDGRQYKSSEMLK